MPPCRKVIPSLIERYKNLKEKGLVVIGFTKLYGNYRDDTQDKGKVTPEEERELIQEFVKKNNIVYPVAIADKGTAFEAYGVSGIPTLIVIDKKGIVRDVEVGAGDPEELKKRILELLK